MMDAFSALLEARDPALGRFRAYRLEAGTDLLGDWLVDITYGRIGTRGRRIRYFAQDEAEAKKLVRESLRRRSTAKRRIGVPYRFCQLIDPHQWFPVALEQRS
jgi:predicted DNA-binding WGR domain protein